jgi:hypothetical protein
MLLSLFVQHRLTILRRFAVVAAALLLALALHYAITDYLHVNREYHGFTYRPPTALEIACIIALILAVALVFPTRISRPSSIVLLFLFVMVYLPAVVISLCLNVEDRIGQYAPTLCCMAVVFILGSLVSRSPMPPTEEGGIPGNRITWALVGVWAVSCALLVYVFGSIISIASFLDVYEQRALGIAEGLGMGYLQTYFSAVLSPALFAIGLARGNKLLMLLGAGGAFLMYTIAAQRVVLLIPVAMLAVHFLYKRGFLYKSVAGTIAILAGLIATCVYFSEDSLVGSMTTNFVVDRTFAIPGLTISQYLDTFNAYGHTYWSHVRGLDLVVNPPEELANYPDWPGLGYIVGSIVYGNRFHNVNANPFSADGLAAAGPVGVLVVGVIIVAWLFVFDRAARGWNERLAVLATVPIAFILTNGQFFTTMLSFGGFFWLFLFWLYKPPAAHQGIRT